MPKSLLGNTPFDLPPMPKPRNAMLTIANALQPKPYNAMLDWRPKTEWVSGYWRQVPMGPFGYRTEWVPGYWRRADWS